MCCLMAWGKKERASCLLHFTGGLNLPLGSIILPVKLTWRGWPWSFIIFCVHCVWLSHLFSSPSVNPGLLDYPSIPTPTRHTVPPNTAYYWHNIHSHQFSVHIKILKRGLEFLYQEINMIRAWMPVIKNNTQNTCMHSPFLLLNLWFPLHQVPSYFSCNQSLIL